MYVLAAARLHNMPQTGAKCSQREAALGRAARRVPDENLACCAAAGKNDSAHLRVPHQFVKVHHSGLEVRECQQVVACCNGALAVSAV